MRPGAPLKHDLSGTGRSAVCRCLTSVRGIAACLLLTIHGCSLIPPKSSPDTKVEVPNKWSAADVSTRIVSRSLAQWWLNFNDPLLSAIVVQALQVNTSVNAAQSALKQARALRDVAAAGLQPTLGISASAQRNKAGSSNSTSTSNFKAGLDASWEIDIFGANRSALEASEAAMSASAASLGDVQVSIAAEVALSYITLRGLEARLAIAENNLDSQLETLQITQWREQAGLVSFLESEQARTAAQQTRALVPLLLSSIEQARHAIAVLTGQPPAALSMLLSKSGAIPKVHEDLALSIPAETLRQRPDVRAAEHQVKAAVARVIQADAARMPSFKLSGSLGLNALKLGSLTNGASVVSALLAGVSMPILDGGAGSALVRAQQAALDQARYVYKATILKALKEVEDALVALNGDRKRWLHLQQAVEAAGNASLMARQRYESGIIDFQVVLITQRAQFTTQESLAGAIIDVSADYVRLYKALGGGWRPDDQVAISAQNDKPSMSAGL